MIVHVFSGGAAVKAGVQEGDRIIKVLKFRRRVMSSLLVRLTGDLLSLLSQVNGSQVSLMSHQEVVKLIKCEFKLPHLYCETLL